MDDNLLTALYHAASSEEPDTMDGPSLCDYYQRRAETEHTRRALVDAVPGLYKRLPAGPGAVNGDGYIGRGEPGGGVLPGSSLAART